MAICSLRLLASLSFLSIVQANGVAAQCEQGYAGKKVCLDQHSSLIQTMTKIAKVVPKPNSSVNATSPVNASAPAKVKPSYTYTAQALPPGWEIIIGQIVTGSSLVFLILCMIFTCGGCMQNWVHKPPGMEYEALMQFQSSWKYYLILLSHMCVSAATTGQFLPSLTQMQFDFDTVPIVMSATLQVGWVAKALSAVSMPYLADKFGKCNMLMFCAMVGMVGSLGCAMAPSLFWFFTGRIFQGIGTGGEPIIFMMCRDVFEDPLKRMAYMSSLVFALILVPIAAPALGGVLANYCTGFLGGWRFPFEILYMMGFGNALAIHYVLPDTTPVGAPERSVKEYAEDSHRVMHDKHLMTLLFVMGGSLGLVYSIDTNLSLIFGNVYHMDTLGITLKISMIMVSVSLAMFEAWYIPDHMHWSQVTMVRCAVGFGLLLSIFGFVVFAVKGAQTTLVFGLLCDLTVFTGVLSYLTAEVLYFQPIKEMSGAAAGMMTFSSTFFAAICSIESSVEGYLEDNKVTSLAFFIATLFLMIGGVFWYFFGLHPPDWALNYEDELEKLNNSPRRKNKKDDDDGPCCSYEDDDGVDRPCCQPPACFQGFWKGDNDDSDRDRDRDRGRDRDRDRKSRANS